MVPPRTLPPGLTGIVGPIKETHSGGVEDWLEFDTVKYYTNAFIVEDSRILLGYKKRGFGQDMYNGFGGKLEPGETAAQAAVRELEEEAGIVAPLKKCGVLYFTSENKDHAFYIDVFIAKEYTGTISETDEMRPKWFATTAESQSADQPPIPYSQMWEEDIFWIPLLLADKSFVGRADFGADGNMRKWWFAETHFD